MTTAIPSAALTRPLAESERVAYERDGAAVLREVLPTGSTPCERPPTG